MSSQRLFNEGTALCFLLFPLLCLPAVCSAYDEGTRTAVRPLIEVYEPNVLGYTWQDDDVGFIDVTVSLKNRLLPDHISAWTCPPPDKRCKDRWRIYLAFTGRFGFYYGTRDSDPVISKAFTPKLLLRYTPDSARNDKSFWSRDKHEIYEDWSYVDLGYAHESNGQTISTEGAYGLERRANRTHPEFALDQVSRGWDYLQLAGKYSLLRGTDNRRLAAYADLKYFLEDGLLQGMPEEYHSFEKDPDAKKRSAVEGVMAAVEYEWRQDLLKTKTGPILADPRVMLQLDSGYDPAFKYGTVRLELGAKLIELPIVFWYEDGYSSSLARYYKRTRAIGIELRLAQ